MTISRSWPHPEIRFDLQTLRAAQPLTHVLTNIVVTNFTANVLLAIGAAPAMVIAEEEAGQFAQVASGLLINVGTVTAADARAQLIAAEAAHKAGTPWALDPVAVGFLSLRTRIASELLAFRPAIIRGNASEILALAGVSAGGRGVDSTSGSHEAIDGAKALAKSVGAVVAVSGEVDYLTDGDAIVEIPGGHVIMTRVTGVGCALGATMAAFLGAKLSPLRAATAASAVFARAGERAVANARGPGSFAVNFLDELSRIGDENDAD
jgi:hydroxyethylthiazole kinase